MPCFFVLFFPTAIVGSTHPTKAQLKKPIPFFGKREERRGRERKERKKGRKKASKRKPAAASTDISFRIPSAWESRAFSMRKTIACEARINVYKESDQVVLDLALFSFPQYLHQT